MFLSRLWTVTGGLRRIAASGRGIERQLRRIADALEAGSAGGTALRTYYRDDRPGAVDDAALFTQSDADFAELERRETAKRHAGQADRMEDELEDAEPEPWRT